MLQNRTAKIQHFLKFRYKFIVYFCLLSCKLKVRETVVLYKVCCFKNLAIR